MIFIYNKGILAYKKSWHNLAAMAVASHEGAEGQCICGLHIISKSFLFK